MARPIPNQAVNYLLLQFKQAKFDNDPERMYLMFNSLLWQYRQLRLKHKGRTQKMAATITKLRRKLAEAQSV